MRPFVIVVATFLACTRAPAQMAQSKPMCPSPDSVSAPPVPTTAVPSASGRTRIRIRDGGAPRFITYVVDSQFVLLQDNSARDSMSRQVLNDLSPDDIESIIVLKETGPASEWRTWHSCPGVPVVLIVTKSKRWRPRTAGLSKAGE